MVQSLCDVGISGHSTFQARDQSSSQALEYFPKSTWTPSKETSEMLFFLHHDLSSAHCTGLDAFLITVLFPLNLSLLTISGWWVLISL